MDLHSDSELCIEIMAFQCEDEITGFWGHSWTLVQNHALKLRPFDLGFTLWSRTMHWNYGFSPFYFGRDSSLIREVWVTSHMPASGPSVMVWIEEKRFTSWRLDISAFWGCFWTLSTIEVDITAFHGEDEIPAFWGRSWTVVQNHSLKLQLFKILRHRNYGFLTLDLNSDPDLRFEITAFHRTELVYPWKSGFLKSWN